METNKTAETNAHDPPEKNIEFRFGDTVRFPEKFSTSNRMVMLDLNNNRSTPRFYLYTKDDITRYVKNPYQYEKQLRNAVIYMYGASAHFRRLIQYFVALNDLSYIISPYKIDTATARPDTVKRNYKKVSNLLRSMDLKNAGEKILTVCLREDVFYGTFRETTDSVIIQQLPSDYCAISVIEDNVLNVSFDFSYFAVDESMLDFYPEEFRRKYNLYVKDRLGLRWQELDSPTSFAVKCNKDILRYAMPPFIGILRELFDLEDLKQLKITKAEIENYAMLSMTIPLENGEWGIDLGKAKEFWKNLDAVLPDEIGSVLTPMPIEKISFERTHTDNSTDVADAEESLFTSAGVSSLLFNNVRASSNALALSIKVDQALTYSIVKSLEGVINRFIAARSYGKYFRITFLDVSPFNRKDVCDQYLKACQYGLPMLSAYAAAQGISQDDIDGMNFLEDTVLDLKSKLVPLKSSNNTSSDVLEGNVGRPRLDDDELSDEGERSREKA